VKAHLRLRTLDLRHAALGSLTRARHGHESQANANAPIPFVLSHRFVVSLDPLSLVAVQQTVGLGWALALMLIEWGWNRSASPAVFSLTAWGWAAATGVIFFALGYWLYFSGLKAVRAHNAAPFLEALWKEYASRPDIQMCEVVIPLKTYFWLDFSSNADMYTGKSCRGWNAVIDLITQKQLVANPVTQNPFA
jgi:EamA-like transporter family